MGRRLNRNDSALCFDRYYRGCIWGLLPLHLHSFKKLVPQARRHSKYGKDEKPLKGFEEGSGRCEGKGPADRPRLQRTYSIHHLEPSSRYLDGLSLDPKHAISVSKIADALEPEACVDSSDSSDQDASDHDAADESESSYEDFFDAFKIDKKLFIENTQKSDAEDPESMKSNRVVVSLRRSGSFPLVNRSGRLTPSKLENKLADAWPSSSSSSSSFSSSSSSLSMLARSRSMDCKTRVGELEDLLAVERWKSSQSGDYTSDVRRYKLSRTRRARSLNSGSLEKYSQLFETSFGRDVKLGVSKSLRLSDEGGPGFNLAELKYLKKTRSVQEARWIEPSDCVEFSVVSEDEAATADPTMSDVSGVVGGASAAELNSYSESEWVEDHDENESSGFRPSLELLIESEAAETHLGAHSDSLLNSDSERTTAAKWNDSVHSTYLQASLKLTGLELKNDLDHQLLSDLVNEALHGLYSGSDAYWQASLCSDGLTHPLPPSDHHVFKKVESTLQKLESFSLKASNTLDSLLAFDLAGDRSWMSLQADAESLSLALDEIIFDELMDELIYE